MPPGVEAPVLVEGAQAGPVDWQASGRPDYDMHRQSDRKAIMTTSQTFVNEHFADCVRRPRAAECAGEKLSLNRQNRSQKR
jgi:hypothetical protein